MSEIIKSYKGFNKDMTCRGFQYEEGKEYETGTAEVCKSGFHACEYPLDCFVYYRPSESIFHEVEQNGDLSKQVIDTKVASTKIKIGAHLTIAGMVKATIDYIKNKTSNYKISKIACDISGASGIESVSKTTQEYSISNTVGDYSASIATGYRSVASTTGDHSVSNTEEDNSIATTTSTRSISNTNGDGSIASATGRFGISNTTGCCSISCTTNKYSTAIATDPESIASTTGIRSVANTGYKGVASTTGIYSSVSANDKDAIAVAWSYKSKAKGVLGSYLILTDWYIDSKYDNHLSKAKMVLVDDKEIKENVWYTMKHGEIIEAEAEEEDAI